MAEKMYRILRIIEYSGTRAWVEACVEQRSVKGTHRINAECVIREAIIGEVVHELDLGEIAANLEEKEKLNVP